MNNVTIMGRLASNPELKRTSNDIAVVRFTIAVSRYSKDGNQTDWIDCVAWRNTAEFISRYFSKGQMILVEGSIKTGSYEDKNGSKRKTTDVLVDRVEFCGDKENKTESYGPANDDDFSVVASDDDLPW